MSKQKLAKWCRDRKITSKSSMLMRKMLRPMLVQPGQGQAYVEYALLLGFIALAIIGILVLLGPSVGSVFSGINSSIKGCSDVTKQVCPQDISSYPTPTGLLVNLRSIYF